MRPVTLLFTFLFSVLIVSPAHAFEVRGMEAPESFIVDPATGVYYVSNVAGSPGKRTTTDSSLKSPPMANRSTGISSAPEKTA